MSTSVERRRAQRFYEEGYDLFVQGRYHEALIELHRAENAFRELDARGQPFSHPLSNGISGLANSLALSGRCLQKLQDYQAAITCFETSLINAKFEKKKAFRTFLRDLNKDLTFCYERILDGVSPAERDRLLAADPVIDGSFRFPYSLPPDVIPFARLYELDPDRWPVLQEYYERAKARDAEKRRAARVTDESALVKLSIYVWGMLGAVWLAYALIVLKSLIQ